MESYCLLLQLKKELTMDSEIEKLLYASLQAIENSWMNQPGLSLDEARIIVRIYILMPTAMKKFMLMSLALFFDRSDLEAKAALLMDIQQMNDSLLWELFG